MKNSVMVIITFLSILAACDNAVDPDNPNKSNPKSPADNSVYIDYSAGGPDVYRFLGRQWAKEGSDFIWVFKNDGTVSVIHCCGEVYPQQFSYLFSGNILITYGSEEFSDEMEATIFTMTETDNGVSFTRSNGISFTQGGWDAGFPSDSPLDVSNEMLGVWQEEDGTKYAFSSDAGLKITTPSGDSEQYGYLVRYKALITLGPLIDGTQAVLGDYRFNQKDNKLYLLRSDGLKITLSRLE